MIVVILMALMLFVGYRVGCIRIKEKLKMTAYLKQFNMRQESRNALFSSYESGFRDGMTHVVEEVTNEHLTYWNGR